MADLPRAANPSHYARRAARSDTLEKLARLGYAVKGVLYLLIGVLAAMAAVGAGGTTTDSRGAISRIAEGPFGKILLWVVALGLVGYALWRLVEAISDPGGEGSDAKGIAKRLGYAGSGLLYGGLAVTTFNILLANGSASGDGNSAETWTATLMQQPYGPWLVGIAGVITLGIAAYQLYKAYRAGFWDELDTGAMNPQTRDWTRRTGQVGIGARGVVFGVIGGFLIVAAVRHDPSEARGLDEALDALAGGPFGTVLLLIVALGLAAYGIYCFINAGYRSIGDRG